MVHPDDPAVTIARVELGLTLYLDPDVGWAHQGATELLRNFLSLVPPELLCWYWTSHSGRWFKAEPPTVQELPALLSLPWSQGDVRHLFELGCSRAQIHPRLS